FPFLSRGWLAVMRPLYSLPEPFCKWIGVGRLAELTPASLCTRRIVYAFPPRLFVSSTRNNICVTLGLRIVFVSAANEIVRIGLCNLCRAPTVKPCAAKSPPPAQARPTLGAPYQPSSRYRSRRLWHSLRYSND